MDYKSFHTITGPARPCNAASAAYIDKLENLRVIDRQWQCWGKQATYKTQRSQMQVFAGTCVSFSVFVCVDKGEKTFKARGSV